MVGMKRKGSAKGTEKGNGGKERVVLGNRRKDRGGESNGWEMKGRESSLAWPPPHKILDPPQCAPGLLKPRMASESGPVLSNRGRSNQSQGHCQGHMKQVCLDIRITSKVTV